MDIELEKLINRLKSNAENDTSVIVSQLRLIIQRTALRGRSIKTTSLEELEKIINVTLTKKQKAAYLTVNDLLGLVDELIITCRENPDFDEVLFALIKSMPKDAKFKSYLKVIESGKHEVHNDVFVRALELVLLESTFELFKEKSDGLVLKILHEHELYNLIKIKSIERGLDLFYPLATAELVKHFDTNKRKLRKSKSSFSFIRDKCLIDIMNMLFSDNDKLQCRAFSMLLISLEYSMRGINFLTELTKPSEMQILPLPIIFLPLDRDDFIWLYEVDLTFIEQRSSYRGNFSIYKYNKDRYIALNYYVKQLRMYKGDFGDAEHYSAAAIFDNLVFKRERSENIIGTLRKANLKVYFKRLCASDYLNLSELAAHNLDLLPK